MQILIIDFAQIFEVMIIRAGTNVNYQLQSFGCVIFELFEASRVLWAKLRNYCY